MKTGIIVAAAVGVVVVGAGGYMLMSKGGDSSARTSSQSSEEREEGRSGMGSLRSLLGLGENLVCTISQEIPGQGTYSGVTYIAGENIRGDFAMTVDGQAMESHMIQDGEYMYTWGETPFGTMATKFKLDADVEISEDVSSDEDVEDRGGELFDAEEDVEYNCEPWRVDSSKFVPPRDITFTDMDAQINAQMEAIQGGSFNLGGGGSQCGVCDQAPDADSKAQCRAALGCE